MLYFDRDPLPQKLRQRKESTMSQSFTYIDAGGNQAQYTVYEKDRREEFYWSTDHGDQGLGQRQRWLHGHRGSPRKHRERRSRWEHG